MPRAAPICGQAVNWAIVLSLALSSDSRNQKQERLAEIYKVIVNFTDENVAPLTGADYSVVVKKARKEVIRSEVFEEVDFGAKDAITGRLKGLTKAFGPFAVLTT